ncbi:MAG: AAA family ATPase [Candidatus Woesearchaeota archaeon]
MGLFEGMLGEGESLFKNEDALDTEFVPKLLPYRENQQRHIATCIKPLLQDRNGRNLFIYGAPGVGKTAAMRWVFRDLEDTTEEVIPIYINCWQKNTTYKIAIEICEQLGYRFTQNKNTEELFKVIQGLLNKNSVVLAFDEIDKAEDYDFLYTILNDVYKKSVFLITNYKEWLDQLEDRIKSRLLPETIEFAQYNRTETAEILKQRISYAFVPGVWDSKAFEMIADKTTELKDIRAGLYLLKEAGRIAEENSSKKILPEHAEKAISKISDFKIKNSAELEDDTRLVLSVVKENSGQKIGDLYNIYKEKNGMGSYKTFQRRIEKLSEGKFITTDKICGKEGNTTIVSYTKKLTEF